MLYLKSHKARKPYCKKVIGTVQIGYVDDVYGLWNNYCYHSVYFINMILCLKIDACFPGLCLELPSKCIVFHISLITVLTIIKHISFKTS